MASNKVLPLEVFEAVMSDVTVIRVSRKLFGMDEVVDVRLWGVTKDGKSYPRRGKALCLLKKNWEIVLKLFKDNQVFDVSLTTS